MLHNIRIRYERGHIVDQADGTRAVTARYPIIEDLDDPQAFAGVLVQNITFSISAGDLVPRLLLEVVPTGSLTIEGPTNVQELNRLNPNSELSHPDVVNHPQPAAPQSPTIQGITDMVAEALLGRRDTNSYSTSLAVLGEYLSARYRECLPPAAMQRALGTVTLNLPITEDMIIRSSPHDIRQTVSEAMAVVFQRMLPGDRPGPPPPAASDSPVGYDFNFDFQVPMPDGSMPPQPSPPPPRAPNQRSIAIDPPGRPARVHLDI